MMSRHVGIRAQKGNAPFARFRHAVNDRRSDRRHESILTAMAPNIALAKEPHRFE
jgi:hypothetical protein